MNFCAKRVSRLACMGLLTSATLALASEAPGTAVDPVSQVTAEGFVLPEGHLLLSPEWMGLAPALTAVDVVGHTVFSTEALQALVKPYLGREGDADQLLEQLRVELSRYYVDRGYVNSGAIIERFADEQGHARLRVVEGRLTEFQIDGLDGLQEAYVTSRLWPDTRQVFNLNTLQEDFQLLLGNPLFAKMRSNVVPGAMLGEAILDLQVQRGSPWSGYLALDNYRSPLSGEYQAVAGVTVRNLTGWGDWLDATVSSTESPKDTSSYSLAFNFPVPYLKTVLGLSATQGQTLITDPSFKVANFNNTSHSTSLSLTQPLVETLASSLLVSADWEQRVSNNFAGQTPYSVTLGEDQGRSENKVVRYGVTYARRSESWAGMARLTASVGHHSLVASALAPVGSVPPNDYRSTLFQWLLSYRISPNWIASFRGATQSSATPLIGMERYTPTGIQAVRGYLQSQDAYDNASTASLELQWILPPLGDLQWSLTPFYDMGQGSNLLSAVNYSDAVVEYASAGLAVNGQWRQWSFSLSVANAMTNVASIPKGYAQSRGLQFQMRYAY